MENQQWKIIPPQFMQRNIHSASFEQFCSIFQISHYLYVWKKDIGTQTHIIKEKKKSIQAED